MFGILPFLVQWIALSSIGNQLSRLRHPEKSYWTLLSDFQNLPENEIEKFLPQVCSLLVERDVTQDPDIFAYLEKILADKCAGCVTFGFRACSLLKAASQGPSEGIFRNVLSGGASNNAQTLREERIRYLSDLMESATMQGSHQLPPRVEYLRGIYFRDVVFVLDSLARLGIELKSYPVVQRNTNLRNAISQLNILLFNRMLSKGQYGLQQLSSHIASNSGGSSKSGSDSFASMNTFGISTASSSSQDVRSAQQIAQNCPDVADYSIHLPLQHCEEKVLRILRFVTHECEVLPSKDRCPYLLVCEVLERPYTCKNDRLYAQPSILQPSIQRPPPQQLLENMSHHHQQQQQQVQSPQYNYPPQQPQEPQLVPNNTFASNTNTDNAETSTSTADTNTASIHPLHSHSHIPAHYSPPPSFINDMPQPVYPHQQEQQHQSSLNENSSSNSSSNSSNSSNENLNVFARQDIIPPSSITTTTTSRSSDGSITADTDASSDESIDRVKHVAASLEEKESLTQSITKSGGDTTSIAPNSLKSNKSRRTLLKRRYSSSSQSPTEVRGGYDSSSNDSFGSDSLADSIDDNDNYYYSDNGSNNCNGESDEYLRLQRLSSQQQSQSLPADTLHHPSAVQSPLNIHQKTSEIVEPTLIQSSSSSPLFTEPTTFDDPYSHSSHSSGNENNEQYPPQSSHSCQQHQHPLQPSLPHQSDYTNTQQQPSTKGMEYSNSNINNFENMNNTPPPLPRLSAAVSYNSYSDSSSFTQSQSKCTFFRGKTYEEKRELVRATSVFGHLPGWNLKSFIVKSGDDLRKEMLAMQLIEYCQQVFRNEGLDILLRPYQIISTGSQTGLIEFLEGTKSIDRIKKSYISNIEDPTTTTALLPTLKDYFEFTFGPSYTFVHSQAVSNFVRSLVGYSLVTYVLQVKDRHNANILVSVDGTVIHIDFGFILGESPGFNINFENAPFKLTREYIDVLGGIDSAAFKNFEELFIKGFISLQKHIDGMYAIVQAFYGERRKGVADALRSRVLFANSHADIVGLIRDSLDSWRTKQYDWYQQKANNIVM